MTNSWICVDASIILKLVVEEVYSHEARVLWQDWHNEGREIAAPALLRYEVTSVLRKNVVRDLLTADEAQQALNLVLAFDIRYIEFTNFHQRAFHLAGQLDHPVAYDAHYLALAEYLACEFWTADRRLFNSVQNKLPWVRYVGRIAEA